MTVEELMKPRYKVIKLYPGSEDWEVIDAIISLPDDRYKYCGEIICGTEFFDSYPNIYDRLQWWQDREPDEITIYVKHKENGEIYKIENQSRVTPSDAFTNKGWISLYDCLPATETEYKQYLTSKQ